MSPRRVRYSGSKQVDAFMAILLWGAVGAVAFTLVAHPDGVRALLDGLADTLRIGYKFGSAQPI